MKARRRKLEDVAPLGLPRSAGSVLVVGGTFDPPHLWHTATASAARRRLEAQTGTQGRGWIALVPAARSPHKKLGPLASDEDRVAMLRLAAKGMKRVVVWTDEIDRARSAADRGDEPPPSYTVETLRRLRKRLEADRGGRGIEVGLLIGADQAVKFHLWREFREIMRLTRVLVVLRPPIKTVDGLRRALRRESVGVWTEDEIEAWGERVVPCAVRDVSSTEIRRRAADAASQGRGRRARAGAGALRGLVKAGVAAYIERNGLYGASLRESR